MHERLIYTDLRVRENALEADPLARRAGDRSVMAWDDVDMGRGKSDREREKMSS
jgi:hypothetical protein